MFSVDSSSVTNFSSSGEGSSGGLFSVGSSSVGPKLIAAERVVWQPLAAMVEKQKGNDAPNKRLGPSSPALPNIPKKLTKATPEGILEGYVGSSGGCRWGPRETPWGPPGGRSGDLVADVHDTKCTLYLATPKTAELLIFSRKNKVPCGSGLADSFFF